MTGKSRKRILERYNAYKLGWLHDAIFFVVWLAIIFVVFRFVIGIALVGGDSMEPWLHDGNVVVYARMVPDYKEGDVVSVRVPAGAYYIKRVAAVGGDSIELSQGRVYVNGVLRDEPYAMGETEEESGAIIYPYTVGEGNVFLLGDNRKASMDSRAFGEVSRHQIRGRIVFVLGRGGIRRAE